MPKKITLEEQLHTEIKLTVMCRKCKSYFELGDMLGTNHMDAYRKVKRSSIELRWKNGKILNPEKFTHKFKKK